LNRFPSLTRLIIVVRAYAALIGELLHIAINTVPQLSYSMSSITWYMSKTTPAHLTKTG